jgi:hypothetical protein
MSAWTALTLAVVENALPTDMGNLYRSWVDANPGKAGRLAELVAETVENFRQAAAASLVNEVDVDPTTVPTTGFRHALNSVIFNLGMEMGVQFAPEVYTLTTRADIWLRMVQAGTLRIGLDAGAAPSPSYWRPERNEYGYSFENGTLFACDN